MLLLKSVNFEQRQFQHHRLEQSEAGKLEWIIGRSKSCDLVLSSPEVSRNHGQIVYSDNTYYFVDLGSTSGSQLNGEDVPVNEKRELHPGDLLQLGETFVYVEELSTPQSNLLNPLQVQEQWAGEDLMCRCCRIVDETADIKTFYFVAEPAILFNYLPGQFANLELEINGQTVIRPYSLSSSPTRPHHLSITVKRVAAPTDRPDLPAGLVSNWLHDHLQVGDRVKLLGGAFGHFTCLPNIPPKLLLISAGSGITPMLSMTRWMQDTLTDCDIVFLHSARTSEDVPFRAELEAIAAQMPNFHLAVTVTQQPLGRAWMGLTGRISESMLQLVVSDFLERQVYVCGPAGFMQNLRSLLEQMQFPMQNYHEESFGSQPSRRSTKPNPAPTTSPEPENQFEALQLSSTFNPDDTTIVLTPPRTANPSIHFLQSDCNATTDDSASILEAAEQEGVTIRHACRVGACGVCKVRVRQGKVRYHTPPAALSAADEQAGYALACVGYPVEHVAIEA